MKKSLFLLICLSLMLPTIVFAEEEPNKRFLFADCFSEKKQPSVTGISINIDQDFFLPFPTLNQDRNYTMGASLEIMGNKAHGFSPMCYGLNFLNSSFVEPLLIKEGKYSNYHSFRLGNSAYTPDKLQDPDPIRNDRPYASLLTISNYKIYINEKSHVAVTTELTLGVLGLRFSGNLQRQMHQDYRQKAGGNTPYDPRGWKYQISDGGELTAKYTVSYNKPIFDIVESKYFDLTFSTEGSVGYYTNAAVGGIFRAGRINSHYLTLTPDPIGYKHKGAIPVKKGSEWEAYLFADYRARAVLYNVLLQGQFRKTGVIFRPSQVRRVLHELHVGVKAQYRGFAMTYVLSAHSPEFKASEARDHYWAGVYLTFPISLD